MFRLRWSLRRRWIAPALLTWLAHCGTGVAMELPASAEREVDFSTDVLPLFIQHCQQCHGEEKQRSELRLDLPEGIARGGESGEPLFLRGNSAMSHVIKMVAGVDPEEVMPPKGTRLTGLEVGILRAWIDQGAKMPGVDASADASAGLTTDHWSFQPVKRPPVPAVPAKADERVRNEIDRFLWGPLEEIGLTFSKPADRATLIRRLYLVMHGLPPTPEEVGAFEEDRSEEAYRDLVERVLGSPRYGERWARHWLDVVRYADSNGFETNRERKNAYPYRDYVIAAFNSDKPYDRFIKEQLAGDAMGTGEATGFLVAGPHDIVKSPDIGLTLMQRQDELADMVNTTGTAFLGLTLGCARCHNHKFDPVLQKDYYAFQAVFAGVTHGDRTLPPRFAAGQERELAGLRARLAEAEDELGRYKAKTRAGGIAGAVPENLRPAVNAQRNTEEFDAVDVRSVRFTIRESSASEPCLDELEIFDLNGENVALALAGGTPSASGTLPGHAIHQLQHINDGRYGNGRSWISSAPTGWVQIDFSEEKRIGRIVWGRDREGHFEDRVATRYVIEAATVSGQWKTIARSDDREPYVKKRDPEAFLARLSVDDAAAARRVRDRIEELKAAVSALSDGRTVWSGNFQQPDETHRLYRGDPFQKREVVAPDALTVLGSLGMGVDESEQQRRLKLAEWIASSENPLTARVMVNRLWQYIFGAGIADTASDLGANGVGPTHPELLDWLADEFVKSGWSIKSIQRLILNSHAFQQSGEPNPAGLAQDAGTQLLWRFPPRRLEAEAMRDCILAVSGALDLRMGGPGFYLLDVEVENVMHYYPKEEFGPPEFRRMVYLFKIRQEQDSIFGSFDCPDGNQVMARRSRSNTPLQALNLFNSGFVLQQAGLLSKRLRQEAGETAEAQIQRAFALAYAREPDRFELEVSETMIREQGLEAFFRALYNTSEFLFVF